jgi:hypothetical protein
VVQRRGDLAHDTALGQFSAALHTAAQRDTPALVFDGHIAGTRLQARPPHDVELQADAQGLRVVRIGTPGADVAGRVFSRGGC